MSTTLDIDAALNDVLDHEYDQASSTPVDAHPEPYITALPVSALFADPTYQRDLDPFRVDKMAADYRIALVGIIEVSKRRDGRFAVLDGQHRVATVKARAFGSQNEDPHVPVRVHDGLSVTEEASLYHQLNTTRRQLTGWDRWVARRGAGDQTVLDIEASIHRAGLITGTGVGANILRATGACEKVASLGGVPLLDEVLSVLRRSWPDDQSGLDGAIITGLGHVLNSYHRDELDLVRMVDALSGVLPRQLTARSAAVREIHKGTLDRLTAHVIVERYNTTKGARVQPFFERVKPLAKAVDLKAKRRKERNASIVAWARENGWPEARKVSAKLREAYAAAHGSTLVEEGQ